MKNISILLLLIFTLSCINDSEPITNVNLTVTQELFGNASLTTALIVGSDLDDSEKVREFISDVTTASTARERTYTAITHNGEPFAFILFNTDRYTRLRIDVDRTGHRPISLLSIPEVSAKMNVFLFNNGNKELTNLLEERIRKEIGGSNAVIIRKANY
jgi:hypothetical protein